MSSLQTHRSPAPAVPAPGDPPGSPARDASGYVVFSAGEAGRAHVTAHRMLDQGQYRQGRQLLGAWLEGRTGAGSEWVHLQWHMAVFELAEGEWDAAYARFRKFILPAAAGSEDALTDAPALLWRLALAAPAPVDLPWGPVRERALARMRRRSEPYVELHNLLAVAGAGDLESLDRWIRHRGPAARSRQERLVALMAVALRALALGARREAAALMSGVVPFLSEIGGSRAQNQLFEEIEKATSPRPVGTGLVRFDMRAA